MKTDIGKIVDRVKSVLEELESRINEEIDRLAAEHIANIEKKENYWCCDERTSEIEKTLNEVHEELSENGVEHETFTKVKTVNEKLAEAEYDEKFRFTLDLGRTEYAFHDVFYSFNVDLYALEALVDDRGLGQKVKKTDKQILHVRKLIDQGDLDGLKSYLGKFPENIRRYLLESDSVLSAAVQACDFNLVRYFVDDCQLAIGDSLLEVKRDWYGDNNWNLETAEKIATYLVHKQPSLAGKLLSFAVYLNSVNLCRLAIDEYKVKIDQPLWGVTSKETAVFKAANDGKWEVFEYLCKKGAELSNGTFRERYSWYYLEDCNILHAAVAGSRYDMKFIQHCLWNNRDFLYHRNESGQTPVELALKEEYSNRNWMKFLMPRVPNVLHMLNKSIVNRSINNRKQWNRDSLYTYETLSKAIEYRESRLCHFKEMEWLDWTVRDPSTGMTLLHKAAKIGNLEAVRFLVKHIDVNCRANDGQTPLHLAVFWGHIKITICLLVKNEADWTLKDNKGRSVRYRCEQGFRRNHKRCCDILDFLSYSTMEYLKTLYSNEYYPYISDSTEDDLCVGGGNRNPEIYEVDDSDDYSSDEDSDFDDEDDDADSD